MSKSRAWIVEEYIPEGQKELHHEVRTKSRFAEWREKQKWPDGRPAHWRIIRLNRDPWENVRRRDRMVLEEAMQVIRSHMSQSSSTVYRLRNVFSQDYIMGDILKADLVVSENGQAEQGTWTSA